MMMLATTSTFACIEVGETETQQKHRCQHDFSAMEMLMTMLITRMLMKESLFLATFYHPRERAKHL